MLPLAATFFSVALPFGPTKWGVITWQQSSRFPAQTQG
jgi:hypothetical protein